MSKAHLCDFTTTYSVLIGKAHKIAARKVKWIFCTLDMSLSLRRAGFTVFLEFLKWYHCLNPMNAGC